MQRPGGRKEHTRVEEQRDEMSVSREEGGRGRDEWRESQDLGNPVCHYFFGSRPKNSDQVGCNTRIKPPNVAKAENEHVTRLPLEFS